MKARRRATAHHESAPSSERKPVALARMAEDQARAAGLPPWHVSAVAHRVVAAVRAFAMVRELYGWNIFPVPAPDEIVRRVVAGALTDHRRGVLERRVG